MTEPKLEKFIFAHTLNEQCITEIGGARRAILPVFKMGVTSLVDDRTFKMDDEDFALLKQNLAKKGTPCPVLFEHAEGPRGGLGGGKVISLQLKDGDIFAHATLTKRAYEECKDEEWLSCSGGFLARRDDEGNIRPVEMLEVSFTNLPAFPGLSGIQTFSVLTPKDVPTMLEIKEPETQVEVLPETPPVTPEAPVTLEAAPVDPLAVEIKVEGAEAALETLKAVQAEVEKKEQAVEAVKAEACNPTVGETIAAMQEQIDGLKALVDALLNPAEPEPDASDPAEPAEPAEMATQAVPAEQVVELTAEQNEAILEMVVTARVDEKVKATQVVALMAQGEAEGKILPSNREAMEKFAKTDPDAFKVALSTMKPILTKRTVNDAVIRVDLGLLDMSPEREAEILSKAFQLQAKHPDLSLAELTSLVKKHI